MTTRTVSQSLVLALQSLSRINRSKPVQVSSLSQVRHLLEDMHSRRHSKTAFKDGSLNEKIINSNKCHSKGSPEQDWVCFFILYSNNVREMRENKLSGINSWVPVHGLVEAVGLID